MQNFPITNILYLSIAFLLTRGESHFQESKVPYAVCSTYDCLLHKTVFKLHNITKIIAAYQVLNYAKPYRMDADPKLLLEAY